MKPTLHYIIKSRGVNTGFIFIIRLNVFAVRGSEFCRLPPSGHNMNQLSPLTGLVSLRQETMKRDFVSVVKSQWWKHKSKVCRGV